jgi:hypothetical protein
VEAADDPGDIPLARQLLHVANRVHDSGVAAAADDEDPVHAIAIDAGERSPTRWGGPFGRVPRFYFSPLLTNAAQTRKAAETILRRSIGMPYSVDFGVIPNPALRPRHAVRVTQKDGNRERHIVETLTIPLDAVTTMTGTTREQTRVTIGALDPHTTIVQPG